MQNTATSLKLGAAQRLRLSEIIGSLSYALDLTEGLPPGHSLRCCWIGMHIGRQLELDVHSLSDLYYALLLKDAGCSSNAGRLFELYGCDEREVKRDFKTVDAQNFIELGKFVLQHAGSGEALKSRVKRLMNLAAHGEELATELVATRCERGSNIALQLGFNQNVAGGIRHLDENWNGKGKPYHLAGKDIPINSRIALLAQVAEVFHAMSGPQSALNEVRHRASTWFDPEIVRAFEAVACSPVFWQGLAEHQLRERVCAIEPESLTIEIDDDRLDTIAEAFAQVVDSKSPYTYGHSARVALYTDVIARETGLNADRRRWLRRGALLHDIGKLGVSNAILDKPGKLDAAEWELVKAHARYSEEILSRVSIFKELAVVAGAHHEKLDGSGYPYGLKAEHISIETRIITVADIFDAITAERPYRGAMPVPQAIGIMEKERGSALDGDCLNALIRCLPELGMV